MTAPRIAMLQRAGASPSAVPEGQPMDEGSEGAPPTIECKGCGAVIDVVSGEPAVGPLDSAPPAIEGGEDIGAKLQQMMGAG